MPKTCKHPCCGVVCRKPPKTKKVYPLKRTPLKKPKLPKGDLDKLTHNELEKVARNAFNRFIRERDKHLGCICGCGGRVEQAGHYFPAGSYSGVMFDERNVNGISRDCNYYKSSAAIDPEYQVGLVGKFGIATVMDLTRKAEKTRAYRWSREELREIIKKYKK
jgi:hypothetical protein